MRFIWQRLERFSLAVTPAALTVLMVLVSAVPLHIPGIGHMMPHLALISIYYWEMFCPGLMPFTFLMVLGLIEDTLHGMPLGVSSAVNIVFALMLIREQRTFGNARFKAVWLGFSLLSFLALALEWVIVSFYYGGILPVEAHLLRWVATCLCYPPLHLLLTRIQRTLLAS
jgi:rod shape-determining protein MreD